MERTIIDKYAILVMEKGINIRVGQSVTIKTGPGTYPFARALAKAAYAMGALHVEIALDDLDVLAARLEAQDSDQVQSEPAFATARDYEMIAEDWAYIRIDSTEERQDHAPLDPEKFTRYQQALSRKRQVLTNRQMRHKLAWCVVCAPGPKWARQALGPDASEDDLWEVLAPILRLDYDDPCSAWASHDSSIKQRVEKLNSLGIRKLHYVGPGTDLTIGLRKEHVWEGGSKELPDGRPFFPNLPTEEIFTVPDMYDAEGFITTTRPVPVMNVMTETVRLTFSAGQVTDFSAEKGAEVMDAFLQMDAGSRRLGECALVDESSPIARSGQIFNSILLDENASCHLALGKGYPSCLSNGDSLVSDAQLNAYGCNTSVNHIDFMVGSERIDIVAVCSDGKEVPIMRKGRFCF